MRKLTMALLGGASICLAVTLALLLWRVGSNRSIISPPRAEVERY